MMVIAAVGDGAYNLVKFLHVVMIVTVFGASFVLPYLDSRLGADVDATRARLAAAVADWTRVVAVPLLVLAGVTGMILVLLSDDAWSFADAWVSASFLVWGFGLVNAILFLAPYVAQRATVVGQLAGGSGDPAVAIRLRRRIGMHTGVGHLIFLILVVLMVWKPGA